MKEAAAPAAVVAAVVERRFRIGRLIATMGALLRCGQESELNGLVCL